jgi:hypothetical protein
MHVTRLDAEDITGQIEGEDLPPAVIQHTVGSHPTGNHLVEILGGLILAVGRAPISLVEKDGDNSQAPLASAKLPRWRPLTEAMVYRRALRGALWSPLQSEL